MVRGALHTDWKIKGVGDFDGDGRDNDILSWNEVSGGTYTWNIENGTYAGSQEVRESLHTSWQIKGVGDFDGDGVNNDILWWNEISGATYSWKIENGTYGSGLELGVASQGGDILTGGDGDDTFVFADRDGADTIMDFTAGAGSDDKIDVSSFSFASYDAFILNATDDGSDTTISFDSDDRVVLIGVQVADLHEDDFIFV